MSAGSTEYLGNPGHADARLKRHILPLLPRAALTPRPRRALLVVPFAMVILGLSLHLTLERPAWYLATTYSAILGMTYASFFFFGHEIGHGTTVRSRRLQDLLLF